MNDTLSTSNLRNNTSFAKIHRSLVDAKSQIESYKNKDNFMKVATSTNTLEDRVAILFVDKPPAAYVEKLRVIISGMSYDQMYDLYVEHMDYVGNLPRLARLFTYKDVSSYDYVTG